MKYIVGIESTAHTFGVGVVDMDGNILSNVRDSYTQEAELLEATGNRQQVVGDCCALCERDLVGGNLE